MKASEAKSVADSVKGEYYTYVLDLIKSEAKLGKYTLCLKNGDFNYCEFKEFMTNLGYKCSLDNNYWEICWAKQDHY